MAAINTSPYTMTLHPGRNPAGAADKAARYIVDRWMPGNAGGVHVMITPRLAKALYTIYSEATKPVYIRVTIRGHIPNLTILDD
jgi:hypothetical protein